MNILYAILVLGFMGGVFGLVLAIASMVFYVEKDERLEPITEELPGANCGGCGFSGCAAYAQAIVDGKAPLGLCAGCSQENLDKIASIMGVESVEAVRQVALVKCRGTHATKKGSYEGIQDCAAAAKLAGNGPNNCAYGCLGFGNCVKACPHGAISLKDGVAWVDHEKCIGCMACVQYCPKEAINVGRMTVKRERYHNYINMLGSCIHSILHQLLHYRSWTLYHFSCRNLVGDSIWQQLDNIAHNFIVLFILSFLRQHL